MSTPSNTGTTVNNFYGKKKEDEDKVPLNCHSTCFGYTCQVFKNASTYSTPAAHHGNGWNNGGDSNKKY